MAMRCCLPLPCDLLIPSVFLPQTEAGISQTHSNDGRPFAAPGVSTRKPSVFRRLFPLTPSLYEYSKADGEPKKRLVTFAYKPPFPAPMTYLLQWRALQLTRLELDESQVDLGHWIL